MIGVDLPSGECARLLGGECVQREGHSIPCGGGGGGTVR